MASSVQRGNKFEIEVKKHLEDQGWSVFRQHRKPLYMKGRMITVGADIFGCDMVCKKKGERTLWIQVSTDGHKSKKAQQLLEHPWNLMNEDVEIWLRVIGRKAYRRFCLRNTGEFEEAPEEVI